VALKILLADDSLTAQNMGKKILVDAGYDVVAVSNGAAAVKKLPEVKPDLAILDVYMPGYTGLEVCERIKNAPETSTIPVLLTVGKMEPFKPEDGNRVRADGVVVKPFEASDLLAAVEKISAHLKPAAPAEPAEYERTIKMAMPLEQDASYAEWQASATPHVEAEELPAKEVLTVPEEMAATPAAGMDLLEPTPPSEPERSTELLEEPAAMVAAAEAAAPAMESFEVAPPFEAAPMEAAPMEVAPAEPVRVPTEPIEIPAPQHELEVFETAEPAVAAPPPAELELTGAAAVGEVAIGHPEGFETTLAPEEPGAAPPATDSLLVTDATEMATAFPTKFGIEGAEPIHVGIAAEMPGLYADEQAAAEAAPSVEELPPVAAPEPDFEALVAARLASEAAAEAAVAEPVAEEMPAPEAAAPAPSPEALAEEIERDFAGLPVEAVPVEEPMPVEVPAPVAEEVPAIPTPEEEMAKEMAAAAEVSASAAVSRAFAEGTQKLDAAQIAQIADIVQRVTERLKAEMMTEIVRELENMRR
jgi:CheY-like chemotaxis protein